MAKNCTCSLLLETIDKIFIDDSCCCQNTTVTPTDNCCNCEPIIDLIDTDKFACVSLDNNRNLKYQLIKESWLVNGTDSKTVYDAIIEALASGIMLLLKVLGGSANDNTKNYVIAPIEISQDVESELYVIKYFKFIDGELHICIYTIRKIDLNEYETSWESQILDNFDASQYYNKIEIDNKFTTTLYITNNYYTSDIIEADFYRRNVLYRKDEIDDLFNTKVLWEKGSGLSSTQRKGVSCHALGNYSFATGAYNTANGSGASVVGTNNTVTGDYTFVAGHNNNVTGKNNITAGEQNTVTSNSNLVAGVNNTVNASFSEVSGTGNTVNGTFNYIGGLGNTIKDDSSSSFTHGYKNEVTGHHSTAFGSLNTITGGDVFAAGKGNEIIGDSSAAIGAHNIIDAYSSISLGRDNIITKDCSFAIGNSNYAKRHYSIAMNESSRATGMSSIAAGRRSYTYGNGSCAIGSPINIKYFAKLVSPNASIEDTYYGYLVLTDENGNPVNIIENSILDKRFRFAAEGKYFGEISIPLTVEEKSNTSFTDRFPEEAVWPQIKDIEVITSAATRYLYFNFDSSESTIANIVWLFNNTDNGIRSISYASGYDGCKTNSIAAHAEGYGTIAAGQGSHSEGVNTFALNRGEHACGTYNYSEAGKTIFSVGMGSEEYTNSEDGSDVTITRKNALEITNDGKTYLRIIDNNTIPATETVYDLGKLLTILIDSTDVSAAEVTSRDIENNNADNLPASIKAL